MEARRKNIKVAFVVGAFPVVSETFIIDQIAELLESGIEVEIFSFQKGDREHVSNRFYSYNMSQKVHCLDMPQNYFTRFTLAVKKVIHVLSVNPMLLFKIFNLKRYRRTALSLQLLFWVEPFLQKEFDLVHCHFGPIANNFLLIKEVLGLRQKMVTTFYGYDVSLLFQEKSADYYDKLKKECSLFFAMSNNMKERIVQQGFEANKIRVLPVGINVDSYPFKERRFHDGEITKIISVGRFVEKKGFDDLLHALSILKQKTTKPFTCHIVGDGPLREELFSLTNDLHLQDVVEYEGYMKIEDIIDNFLGMHLFVQPSKTARNGDME